MSKLPSLTKRLDAIEDRLKEVTDEVAKLTEQTANGPMSASGAGLKFHQSRQERLAELKPEAERLWRDHNELKTLIIAERGLEAVQKGIRVSVWLAVFGPLFTLLAGYLFGRHTAP